MSELAPVPENRIGRRLKPIPGDLDYNPLRSLSKPYRAKIAYLWEFYSHLLPNPSALAIQLRTWIAKYDLTADELGEVMKSLCSPEAAAQMRFASDVMTAFAAEISRVLKRRRTAEEMQRRQREDDEARKEGSGLGMADFTTLMAELLAKREVVT